MVDWILERRCDIERLTKRLNNGTELCIEVCGEKCVDGYTWCPKCKPFSDVMKKLAEYEDAEEQGLLLKKEKAVDEGYLYDWYIHSTMGDEPIWTEAHLEELFNDFILIPKEEAEQALAKIKEV